MKELAINTGLAALAAFTGALAASDGAYTKAVVIAAVYAAVRAAVGYAVAWVQARRG